MTVPTGPSVLDRLANQPIARILAYYVVLAAAVLLLYQVAPDLPGVFTSGRFDELAGANRAALADSASKTTPMEAAREAVIAMLGAYLLILPVAWVYIATRQKRGYQQSLIQTLIILPIVVAAVVVLVKSSVALAFSLGGIVGAISFRNRLEDTKDAIYVFLAIGVGLAAGVQVMSVAVVLSVFFNLVNLILWWTDFGRAPAQFDGPPARQRLDQLRKVQARKTGAFVSQVDALILQSMSPEQLAALADRAQKRRARLSEEIGLAMTQEFRRPRFDGTVRVIVEPSHVEAVRPDVEAVLTSETKSWILEAATTADAGRHALLFKVKFKKSVPAPLVVEAVRRAVAGRAVSVDIA